MVVRVNWQALRQSRWYEYILRFGLGGLATAIAGLVAQFFGPEAGGLFLAFPAILGASATLIEKHERERKKKLGLAGQRREPMPQRSTPPAQVWEVSASPRLPERVAARARPADWSAGTGFGGVASGVNIVVAFTTRTARRRPLNRALNGAFPWVTPCFCVVSASAGRRRGSLKPLSHEIFGMAQGIIV
jgi:Protein of unknown function (DUF3147)